MSSSDAPSRMMVMSHGVPGIKVVATKCQHPTRGCWVLPVSALGEPRPRLEQWDVSVFVAGQHVHDTVAGHRLGSAELLGAVEAAEGEGLASAGPWSGRPECWFVIQPDKGVEGHPQESYTGPYLSASEALHELAEQYRWHQGAVRACIECPAIYPEGLGLACPRCGAPGEPYGLGGDQ